MQRPIFPTIVRLPASWVRPSKPALRILTALVAAVLGCSATTAFGYEPLVNYQLRCMGCHLPDGSGQSDRVPSVRRSLVLFSATPQGRNYVARVPGVAQSPLSDEETAMLLNWMARNLSDEKVPDNFIAYSAAEIHGLREHPLARVKAIRARLWKAATAAPSRP
jgi:hypothetical protein